MATIDTLMRVADDEDVILPLWNQSPQQPPVSRCEILGLINDHVANAQSPHKVSTSRLLLEYERRPVKHLPPGPPLRQLELVSQPLRRFPNRQTLTTR